MATIGRNMDERVSEIRDYFLGAEEEYFNELLKSGKNIKKIEQYMEMPLKTILAKTKKLIEIMEIGAYKDKNDKVVVINEELSQKIEKQLILLIASIDDVELVSALELRSDDFEKGV